MKIIFAKNIGFCFGVKRAIAIVENSLKEGPRPVQFLGYLVHNEEVIKHLEERGGKFLFRPNQAKPGTLITRTHGEAGLNQIKNKGILIKETTCPLVKNVLNKANLLFQDGYQVIIVGDKKHPETKAIKNYIKNQAIIVENEKQAENLSKFKKIGVVSQTTQNLNNFYQILKILKNKAGEVKWFNTICPEVTARQKELNKILENCDGILVIGSHSSANTNRLAEMVKKAKKNLWWINSLEELKKKKIKNSSILGVVSGTSTPDWEIKKIKKWLLGKKQK